MVVNILKRMTTHGRASELDGPGNWTACGSGEWTVVGEAHRQHLALAARGTWYLLGGVGEMAVLLQSCRGQAVRAACSNAGRSLRRRREASRCAAGGSDPWTASERLLPACQACQPHPSDTSSHEHAAADTGPTPSAATKLEAALPTCDGQLLLYCKRHHAAGSTRSQALPGPAGSPARAADPLCSESLHHRV